MPIDPSIALGFRPPQIEGPMNLLSQGLNIQNIARQNQLGQLQIGEQQQLQAERNAQRNFLATNPNLDDPAVMARYQSIAPSLATAHLKALADVAGTKSLVKERESKGKSEELKRRLDSADRVSSAFKYVYDNPAPQNANLAIDMLVDLGGMQPEEAAKFKSNISQLGNDPTQIKAFAEVVYRQGLAAKEQLAKTANVNMGGTEAFTNTDPVTGKTTIMGTAVRTQSPDSVASNETARRGQNMADARARKAGKVAPHYGDIIDPADPTKMIKVDLDKWNPSTREGLVGVAGKEPSAALRENKASEGKRGALDVIDELRASYQTLDRQRAIPSTERNVASNIGSGLAATGAGQVVGRMVGTESQVERDVINSARIRLLNGIKQATGMSAQQLNSNVELQTWLRAVTDPGQSYQAADRILNSLEKFIESGGKYSNKNAVDKPKDNGPPIDRLQEGIVSTFANGQKWTLKDGKAVQVK